MRSDRWPLAFIEQELWLRTRRTVLEVLGTHDLLPSSEEFTSYMNEQTALGNALVDRLALRLPPSHVEYLTSELMCPVGNRPFRTMLPRILAFGFEFGRALRETYQAVAPSRTVGLDLAAVLNLGITLFDYISEDGTGLAELSSVLTPNRVVLALGGASAAKALFESADGLSDPEVAIVVALAAALFHGAFEIRPNDPAQWQQLVKRITTAHAAQLACVAVPSASDDLVEQCRRKTIEPFRIMALLSSWETDADQEQFDRAASRVGDVLLQVDDLIDLFRDWKSRQPNSVLLRVAPQNTAKDLLDDGEVDELLQLLSGRYIEEVANEARQALEDLLRNCDQAAVGSSSALVRWLSMYMLDWIR